MRWSVTCIHQFQGILPIHRGWIRLGTFSQVRVGFDIVYHFLSIPSSCFMEFFNRSEDLLGIWMQCFPPPGALAVDTPQVDVCRKVYEDLVEGDSLTNFTSRTERRQARTIGAPFV